MRQLLLGLMACLWSASGAVSAAELSGNLVVTSAFRAALAKQLQSEARAGARGYWRIPNGRRPIAEPPVDMESEFAVLLFRQGAPKPGPDAIRTVTVRTGTFAPRMVVVHPKTRVKFVSESPFDHELYSPGKYDFKPQLQGPNSFRPIDFYKPGVYQVRCRRFPHMRGWVVVTEANKIAQVNRSGAFKFERLEEGDYRLVVLFRGRQVHEQKIKISGRRQSVSIALKDPGKASADAEPAPQVEGKPPKKSGD